MDKRFEDSSASAEPDDAELSLEEKRHFVESLLDVTHGILYIYDLAKRRNVFANEGIHRILGYSTSEIRELGDAVIPSLMHPDDFRHYLERIVPRYAQVADGERIVNSYRMKSRSGDWRWLESTEIVYRRNADGKPRQILGLGVDITERKAAEQELERHRDHLEELVAQRTTQLESANRELDAFCHSVSHDLRAPLRYLDGFAGLLVSNCREELSDEGRRYVDIVASYAKRMGCLIDDLLEFSRTSRQEMSMQQVSMDLALREALVPVQSASRGRNIEWRIGRLRPVGGDHNLLRQVWANLVENAVKYTAKKDAALIEIGCEPVGTEFVFSVRDNGAGFDPRYADRLFGVFQRLHRSEEFEGTGIGLATVHRILSRHGGRIWAESAVDQGATFRFALPMPIQEAPSQEP